MMAREGGVIAAISRYPGNHDLLGPLSALTSCMRVRPTQGCPPGAWGRVDEACASDLLLTQQGLLAAVTHSFQPSRLHLCTRESSSYRLVKASGAGRLDPLEGGPGI